MNDYELVLVFSPKAGDAIEKQVEATSKAITSAKGKINKSDNWGEKTLSYPILKYTSGVYHYIEFSLPSAEVSRLDRRLKLDENVIRYLLVRSEGSKKHGFKGTEVSEKLSKEVEVKDEKKTESKPKSRAKRTKKE